MPTPNNGPEKPRASRIFDLWGSKLRHPSATERETDSGPEAVSDEIDKLVDEIQIRINQTKQGTASAVTFTLNAGTLREQHDKLLPHDQSRILITDLIVGAYITSTSLTKIPDATTTLISLLPDSRIPEMKKFAIREVLSFMAEKEQLATEFARAELLAKHLLTLRRRLRADTGAPLLQDLSDMSKDSHVWALVLDHVLADKILIGNLHHLMPILRNNYRIAASHDNEERLEQMCGSNLTTRLAAEYLRGERDSWMSEEPLPPRDDDPFIDGEGL